MSNKSKKWMSAILACAMTSSMALIATAAPDPYSLEANDETLRLLQDGKTCTYSLRDSSVSVYTDKAGELIISFYETDGTRRLITLGKQNDLVIDGELDMLTFNASLAGSTNIVIAPDAFIDTISINSPAKYVVAGTVGRVLVDADAKVTLNDGAQVVDVVVSANRAHVIAADGAVITDVYSSDKALVSGVHYSKLNNYTDSKAAAKRKTYPTLGVSGK